VIYKGGNNIGVEGVKHIVEVPIKHLQTLNMCKYTIIQGGIKWDQKEHLFFLKEIG
jgi:hypothetical protein